MSNMQTLQQALEASTARAAKKSAPPPVAEERPAAPVVRASSRVGQVNISAWLDPNFKSGLRLVQAGKGPKCELQDLIAEALNDLFTKYDVPTVSRE